MPKVFISYRQISPTELQRVHAFATRIRDCGVDVVLDQFYLEDNPGGPDEGWALWSENQAENSDKVLVIATADWFQCYLKAAPAGEGLGAAAEAHIVHRRLYAAGTRAAGIRIIALDEAGSACIPERLRDFHHLAIARPGVFEGLITWLGGAPPAASAPATASISSTLTWPAPPPGFAFAPQMANREEEFNFFKGTLRAASPQRGTLISAGSGLGKTRLVSECLRYGTELLGLHRCCLIDLKGNATRDYLLDCLANDLGGPFGSRSEKTLRASLRNATEPLLLVIDTFERAPEDTRGFIESHILGDLRAAPALRVLLAGKPAAFPDRTASTWGSQTKHFELGNIPNPEPWIEWARRFDHVTEAMVRIIVASTRGAPNLTAAMIENLGGYTPGEFNQMGIP